MKRILFSVFFALTIGTSADARTHDQTYLGGALDIYQCSDNAKAKGFTEFVFGPSFDRYGIYYPYWNACFGLNRRPTPVERYDHYYFYPYVKSGYDADRCATELQYVPGIWDCTLWSSWIIECSPTRSMTYSAAKTIETALQRYACVRFVDGPRRKRD